MSVPFVLSYVLLWVLVVFQAMLLLGLVRTVHRLQQGHVGHEPEPAEATSERLLRQEIPRFTALDISGATVDSEQLRGRSSVVLFVSPDCHTCMLTLDELHAVQGKVSGNVLVVCGANQEDCRRLARDYQLTIPVIADEDARIKRLFDVSSSPTAVLLNPVNRVVSYGHPVRGEELEELMDPDHETTTATAQEGR